MFSKQSKLQQDLEFTADKRNMVLLEAPKGARSMVYAIVAFFLLILCWSLLAEIDEVRKGEGIAVPIHQIQKIQNLEGGILKLLAVEEGDRVIAGQTLLILDDAQVGSSEEQIAIELKSLQAKAERLNAEINDVPLNQEDFIKEFPVLASNEISLFTSKQEKLNQDLAVLQSKLEQKSNEITELEGQVRNGKRQLSLANQELKMISDLRDSGAVSEIEIIRAQEKSTDIKKEFQSAESRLKRVQEEKNEIRQTIEQTRNDYTNEALKERDELLLRVNKLQAQQTGVKDKQDRTTMSSPLDGIVKKINVNTIGGVIQPGMTVIEIVPFGDKLLVETKIRPKDIGFIHPGMKAKVKFSAYDFATYGGMDGQVSQVSADAITNEKGESYFLVKVETDRAYLGSVDNKLPVIPGMRGEVDIAVAKKSVFAYFFNPILKGTK